MQEMTKLKHKTNFPAVALASRKNLCLNKDVQKLNNPKSMNDACLSLLRSTDSCSYYDDDAPRLNTGIKDIEDLVEAGKKSKTCPYFASRALSSTSPVTEN